jgi:tetratricopeptide (TPR) repeat protein
MRAVRLVVLALALVGAARADEGNAHTATDTTTRAKALYQAGVLQYNLSEFQKALDNFKSAYEQHPDPVLLFNIGQCHRMLGHAQDAVYAYRAYLREVPNAPNREEVARLRIEMERELQHKLEPTPPTGTMPPTATAPAPPPAEQSTAATPTVAPAAMPATAGETREKPLYKRWWLWTAVAAVAAIAIGVGVGVGAAPAKNAANPGGTAGSVAVKF